MRQPVGQQSLFHMDALEAIFYAENQIKGTLSLFNKKKKIIIIMRENLHVFTNGLRSPHPQHTTIYPLSAFLYES